jgi:hypothetical protein
LADRSIEKMPEEDDGHICTYTVDKDDRNFKYCVYCKRVRYRTDEEVADEYANKLERKLNG